jgi:low temperature requirement protein LtrA
MVAWGSNWLDPDPLAVRVSLVGLMFASLLMSVAIDDAFGDRGWLFVTGYLLLRSGGACSSSWPCAAGHRASTSSTTSSGS